MVNPKQMMVVVIYIIYYSTITLALYSKDTAKMYEWDSEKCKK